MADTDPDRLLAEQLKHIARRDLSVFPEFYSATSGRLFANILGIVKNREAAEDVLQETYIKILNRSGAFDRDRGKPWPWLILMARNTAIDRIRARGRRDNLDGEKYLIAIEEDEQKPLDEALATQTEGKRAMEEVSKYDAASTDCIRAAFYDGLTYSEIAERENLPLGTVKSRIRRGIKHLKSKMDR
ncbi:sigma-70 family RNA polymerase sigma factor [Aurantiacibacter rhizosphaerae]|uniref:Sigma-70 family RNA polymerase sigma factor n=1 Tax=Aurantiacibacter rhizosphaerae TaxID=2691582 RepID=A0A844XD60_9SPHN|nr:sigma-70 family RNA polymerase sigma factor [Aurantiacibacter rhizosphaerae]MWV27564.1 sigma-70 family RNA polymerase sigma factor [Aurantiacibacter rhizosphaerae]